MGVPGRKRKTYKTARSIQNEQQQKLQQVKKISTLTDRVKSTNIGSILHDESDVISFRHSLKQEYIVTSKLIDLLTNQPVPLDRIDAPEIYPKGALELMKGDVDTQQKIVDQLKEELAKLSSEKSDEPTFFERLIDKLADDPYNKDILDQVEDEYCKEYNVSVKANSVIIYRNKFSHLSSDRTEAPADYWDKHKQIIAERKEQERKAKEQEEERKRQEELALAIETEEAGLAAEKIDDVESQQIPDVDPGDPNLLDTVFGEEPFQNEFDDGFGDLDTAFF